MTRQTQPSHAFQNESEEQAFKNDLRQTFKESLNAKSPVNTIADAFSGKVLDPYWDNKKLDHLTNPIGERIYAAIEVAIEEAWKNFRTHQGSSGTSKQRSRYTKR